MILFDLNIDDTLVSFFKDNPNQLLNTETANAFLKNACGINNFFSSKPELQELKSTIVETYGLASEPDRREYGDFQTNAGLAAKVAQHIHKKDRNYEFILEPTCGKGNFILAALKTFPSIKKIVGIEIYRPYVWETKFRILKYFIQNQTNEKPEIDIFHANVFDFEFENLAKKTIGLKTLVIGNPPWVTNAELGSLESVNLPQKSNFKKHSGLDALTGKGNFDIGEYISISMLKNFHHHRGSFAFLVKNAVAKNIVLEQHRNHYRFNNAEKLNIDSKKEFNVSVDACLFHAELNQTPGYICTEMDFYSTELRTVFGWHKRKFVNSVSDYETSMYFDGKSQLVWRQGLKHDCAKVMELEAFNGNYRNGLNEEVEIEESLVYGLLKSSDLKDNITNSYRKLTIVTQRKIGQETKYIKRDFPRTYNYLENHLEIFENRKSSIYIGKPNFSIFGIGDYSFMPYKVAISGMYKTTHFTLVLPANNKALMLDDTCYFIGFDDFNFAQITHFLLNTEKAQKLLKALIFPDSKRSITKDVLMRIDLLKLYRSENFEAVQNQLSNVSSDEWDSFGRILLHKTESKQQKLF